jgi:Domain of unknown function (DUF4148)
MKSMKMMAVATVAMGLFGTQLGLAQQAPAKTRAQVTAECDAARKAGTVVEGECQYEMPAKGTSNKTRSQVRAECDAARKAGKVVEGTCQYEMPGTPTWSKTRDEVKAECAAARKAGTVVEGECGGMPKQ